MLVCPMRIEDTHQAMVKWTKAQAKYTNVSEYPLRIRRCGICDHFRDPHWCELVEGHIRENGGCKLFEPEVLNPCLVK